LPKNEILSAQRPRRIRLPSHGKKYLTLQEQGVEQIYRTLREKYLIVTDNYDPKPLSVVDAASARNVDANKQATATSQYGQGELVGMSFPNLFDADQAEWLRKELSGLGGDGYISLAKLTARGKDRHPLSIDLHPRGWEVWREPGREFPEITDRHDRKSVGHPFRVSMIEINGRGRGNRAEKIQSLR
jgi:hypothetical protein